MSSPQTPMKAPRNPHSVILAISVVVLFAMRLGPAAAEPCLDPPEQRLKVESQVKAAPASETLSSPLFADPGGTVYSLLDVGPYVTDPTDANWKQYAKSIIGYYHTNPEKVRAQLADMRRAGQKRIGILIWFVSGSLTKGGTDWMHTVVPFPDGRLGTQHLANLAGFLKDVDSAGFAEVQIRIATQGYAGPSD